MEEVKTNLGYIWQYAEFDYSDIVGINSKEEIKKARGFLDDYIRLLKMSKPSVKNNHPAYKSNISDKDIEANYKKLKSFNATGEAVGCSAKTVKNRLEKMGYTF